MSKRPKTFFDLYSEGHALEEEIDDFVDAWHLEMKGKIPPHLVELPNYLGMSQEEFDVWVQEPDALPHILNARLERKSIDAVMHEHVNDMLLAARAADKSSIVALRAWLESRNARSI